MTEPSKDSAHPPLENQCALLGSELAPLLAGAQGALARLRADQLQPQPHIDVAALSLAELEAMLPGVLALSFGLSPALPRRRTALGPIIRQALAASDPRSEGRLHTRFEGALVGLWNPWACRRTVHELVTFALALTDAGVDVTACESGQSVRFAVHLTGVSPASDEGLTLARELGPHPSQFHLWLACRLVESSGGRLELGADANGWVGLAATLPGLLPGND